MFLVYGIALALSGLMLGGSRWFWVDLFRPFFLFFLIFHTLSLWTLLVAERGRGKTTFVFVLLTLGVLTGYGSILVPHSMRSPQQACRDLRMTCERISLLFIDRTYATPQEDISIKLLIARESPDVLALVPFVRTSESAPELVNRYAYYQESPYGKESALALFSRIPLRDTPITTLGEGTTNPYLHTTLERGDKRSPLTLTFLRGGMIFDEEKFIENRLYFRRAVSALRSDSLNGIAVLDNVGSVLTPPYQQFEWAAGYQPTASLGDLHINRARRITQLLPSDHVMVKGDFRVQSWQEEFETIPGVRAISVVVEMP